MRKSHLDTIRNKLHQCIHLLIIFIMSQPSLYDFVVPTIRHGLKTFEHILSRAESHAVEKGLDANSVFPEARLIDDQKPL